ncbi:uncharacterized protein [Pyxicephalus adspersus]|uniref:RNA/RNP complex-1-interacting phosphatase n=1 Tax=Pyxicephalus adspersus TaxID=30357 RepID=A0AAV2ZTS3_PYXAD|nr:TPA: hypothetical protein GDO54_004362 [Pyxicephalus adspersus]
MVKKNSIPERWRSLTSIGCRLPGSRFIAFKVPLKGATNQRVTQNQKFTPKDLVTSIRSQNEELGLIIDLTNTERYYTTKDLPRSVQYVKLHTAGLKIPDDATVHQFKRVVRQFLFANEDNDKLIGVHCTTGINRTGYLICRYLIDVDGWRPLQSISIFAQSRGHPIEGSVYIEDLIKGPVRSNVGIDLPPTEEEQKALNSGLEDLPRDEQGNEFGDFDARDRRPMPPMRSEDCLDDFDAREARVAPRNILGDHDLRLPSHEPQEGPYMGGRPEPMYPSERIRRPGDFHLDMENFHDPSPRPLMSIGAMAPREMQHSFEDPGMMHEGMDYDMRGRGRPMHAMPPRDLSSDMQYDDAPPRPLPPFPRNKINNPEFEDEGDHRMHNEMPYREKLAHEGFPGNEDPRFGPRGREAMPGPFRGPVNERMQPRNARPMGGPMAERMNPRDSRLMEGPVGNKLHPGNVQFMDETMNEGMYPGEGPMNERIPQRNSRFMDPQMGERGPAREAGYMEVPRNERMPPRDAPYMQDSMNDQLNLRGPRPSKGLMNEKLHPQELRGLQGPVNQRAMEGPGKERPQIMKGPMGERMHPNTARLMNLMSERMDQRDGQNMEGPAYERMQLKDQRAMEGPMYDRMQLKDPRPMGGPMNVRMPPRGPRPMENSMADSGYAGSAKPVDGSNNEHMYPRDTQAMQGSMNDGMYPRPARPMDSSMNNRMYPRVPRAADGSMNEWMQQGNVRPMERPVNERMHPGNSALPPREPRPMDGSIREDFGRPFEGRKMNPSEEALRAPNRFAPYPPKKPSEGQELRGPHDMAPPARPIGMQEMDGRFPPRSRFQ